MSVHYHLQVNQTAYLLTTGFLKIFIQVLKCNFEIGFRRFTGNSGGCTGSDWRPSRQHYKYLNVDRGPDSVTGMARGQRSTGVQFQLFTVAVNATAVANGGGTTAIRPLFFKNTKQWK